MINYNLHWKCPLCNTEKETDVAFRDSDKSVKDVYYDMKGIAYKDHCGVNPYPPCMLPKADGMIVHYNKMEGISGD